MKPADAFDGNCHPARQQFAHARHDIGGRRGVGRGRNLLAPAPVNKREARPAGMAGGRLGVKAAVARIFILGAARCAHRKVAHRGQRTVVRHAFDDGEARPAVGAVDERITVATVARVEQFAETVAAGGDVRRDGDEPRAVRVTLDDAKVAEVGGVQVVAAFDGLDGRERRRIQFDLVDEAFDRARLALDIDQHARRVVADLPAQCAPPREREDVRAKPDALHDAPHEYLHASRHQIIFGVAHDERQRACRISLRPPTLRLLSSPVF